MKKIVAVMVLSAATSAVAGDLSNPAVMMAAADKAVGSSSAPVSSQFVTSTGVQVGPGVVQADVWTFKSSVAKVGVLKTLAAIPGEFPKTFTVASVLALAVPVIANNPKLLGLEKKDSAPTASSATPAAPTSVEGINVNVSGNSGSTITVVVKPNTVEGAE